MSGEYQELGVIHEMKDVVVPIAADKWSTAELVRKRMLPAFQRLQQNTDPSQYIVTWAAVLTRRRDDILNSSELELIRAIGAQFGDELVQEEEDIRRIQNLKITPRFTLYNMLHDPFTIDRGIPNERLFDHVYVVGPCTIARELCDGTIPYPHYGQMIAGSKLCIEGCIAIDVAPFLTSEDKSYLAAMEPKRLKIGTLEDFEKEKEEKKPTTMPQWVVAHPYDIRVRSDDLMYVFRRVLPAQFFEHPDGLPSLPGQA